MNDFFEGLLSLCAGCAVVATYLYAANYALWYALKKEIPVRAVLYSAGAASILGPLLASTTGFSIVRVTLGLFAVLTLSLICATRHLSASCKISKPSECDTQAAIAARMQLRQEQFVTSDPIARKATLILTIAAGTLLLSCILL